MKTRIVLAVSALVIAVSAGGWALTAHSSDDGDTATEAGLANPASVFCEENGGTIPIIADAAGNQSGICSLPDGTQIEEWEYWRQFHGKSADATEAGATPELGGLTPLAPEGVPEPESDPVLFVEGEPVYDLDSIPVYDEDGNLVPAPET
jgi:putative hemolysin